MKNRNQYTGPALLEDLFWRHVDPCRTDGCWLWVGSTTGDGYGRLFRAGKNVLAHHVLKGTPPLGFEWDHVCRERRCVNPDDLELVTHRENMRRARHQVCPRGHLMEGSNLKIESNGKRRCRECFNAVQRRRPDRSEYFRKYQGRKHLALVSGGGER